MREIMRSFKITILMPLFTFMAWSSLGMASSWDHTKVMGSESCGECHEEAVTVWEETHHYLGLSEREEGEDKAEEFAAALGIDDYTDAEAMCSTCHATVGVEAEGETDPYVLDEGSVNCESCHTPSADWIEVHSNFGGNDIDRKSESPAHRAKRVAAMDRAGMLRPAHVKGLAENCFSCHLVLEEKLINSTDHPAGSDFELVAWSQGEIRHNFTASDGANNDVASKERQRLLFVIGATIELEKSLMGLSKATGGEYKQKLLARAKQANATLIKIANATRNPTILKAAKAGNNGLKTGGYQAAYGQLKAVSPAIAKLNPASLSAVDAMLPTSYQGEPAL